MLGRNRRLLASVIVFLLPPVMCGQDVPLATTAPAFRAAQPPSAHLPSRIVGLPPPPITMPGLSGFPPLARAAGMIFAGTVKKIDRRAATPGRPVETVAVTFHIENSIRGARAGGNLTINQWIGLWSSGQRYAIGEHVLLFLYPRSRLGLTSCVGGRLGRFPIDAGGRVMLSGEQLTAFQKDSVLGGKSRARFSDFAVAVRHASEEERHDARGDREN